MQSPHIINIVQVSDDEEFDTVFAIRCEVFQSERHIPEETEIDGNDHIAHHYLARLDDQYVGTGRWRVSLGGKIRMERLAVLKPYRRHGVGRALMEAMLSSVPRNREIYLHAPLEAVPFYEKLGFVGRGEPFEEAGWAHMEMYLP